MAHQPTAPSSYLPPQKRILSQAHLAAFKRSPTHDEIVRFIDDLDDSIAGKKLSEAGEGSEVSRPLFNGQGAMAEHWLIHVAHNASHSHTGSSHGYCAKHTSG